MKVRFFETIELICRTRETEIKGKGTSTKVKMEGGREKGRKHATVTRPNRLNSVLSRRQIFYILN